MAKPLPQVSTQYDALEYAHAAVKDAFNVCPKAASYYQNVVTMAGQGASVSQLISALDSANKACHLEKYGTASTSSSMKTASPSGAAAPTGSGTSVLPAGFPLWLVLLIGGGALAYYLLSKKPGTKQSRGKVLAVAAKRKVRKVAKKARVVARKAKRKVRKAVTRRRRR